MAYFTQEYLDFFQELAANNQREWFQDNKKRYDKHVKAPFKAFVTDLITAVAQTEPEVQIEAKDAIFRINRDIRFSKDKSPYKLHCSAVVSKHGRKDHAYPGLYLQMNHEAMWCGGGCYVPPKEELWRIRDGIARNPKAFRDAVDDAAFVKNFGGIRGEANKVLPKEFKEASESEPLIYNKQFYYMGEFPAKGILSETLLQDVLSLHQSAAPFRHWLIDAMAD